MTGEANTAPASIMWMKHPNGYCHINLSDADEFAKESGLGSDDVADLIKSEDSPSIYKDEEL